MATNAQVTQIAERTIQIAKQLVRLRHAQIAQLLEKNATEAIDWNNLPDEMKNPNGTIVGTNVTPAEVSNAIGSLASLEAGHFASGHGGNYSHLADPVND